MFSIIIPLYNKAPYIAKAIRSVAAQTVQDFELIIIDDGSIDIAPLPPHRGFEDTPLECLEQLKERAIYIRQENQGVSTARNNGVAMAKYDYIAFLDADDWWAPTYLEEMKALIEKYPEAGIYGSSYFKVKGAKNIVANIGVDKDFESGLINYFQVYAKTFWMPLWTGATIIKKDIFVERKGFKPNLKMGEDFDLWVRIAIDYPVAFVNKALAYYNQDVDINTRAVGVRLYEKHEHMLFTQYNKKLLENKDFVFLFNRLALYGLQHYYMGGKNKTEVKQILSTIDWQQHEKKYYLYYRIFSPTALKLWLGAIKMAWRVKQLLKPAH